MSRRCTDVMAAAAVKSYLVTLIRMRDVGVSTGRLYKKTSLLQINLLVPSTAGTAFNLASSMSYSTQSHVRSFVLPHSP